MLRLGAAAALLGLCWLTSPAAAEPTCSAPAWLKSAPNGVRLDSCTARAWGAMDIPFPDGGKRVFGPWSFVTYLKADEARHLGEAAIRTPVVAAATKAGAHLLSAPDNHTEILLVSGAKGAETYIYYHLLGPEDDAAGAELRTITVAKLPREVETRPLAAPFTVTGTCADPAWLVKTLTAFKRDSCHTWDWASDSIAVPNEPERIVEGRKLVVNYTLADETRTPTSVQLQRNFLEAFKAMGATLVSDADDEGRVVAMQTGPAGEVWYSYQCGSGNAEGCGSFSVTTMIAEPFKREVEVRDMPEGLQQQAKGCADPPWLVRQFAGYKLDRCDYADFAPLELAMPDGTTKRLAGRVLVLDYALADEAHIRLPLAIRRNYVEALQERGATLLTDPSDLSQAILTQSRNGGEYWYIYRNGGGNAEGTNSYTLTTLQIGGPPPKSCKIEVYGVNFDFDKSVLRSDSEPVLQQVLALFADTAFAADVGGHTDNIGTPAYNLKLSDARAAAVKTWIIAHGVAGTRITSHGYGDTQPLLPNTSDENRFKNRRVELKRTNCK